eukprot:g19597.t1
MELELESTNIRIQQLNDTQASTAASPGDNVGQNPFAQQEVAASQAPAGEQNAGGVQEMQIFLEDPDQVPAGGHDDAEQVPGSQPPPPSQPVDDESLLGPAGEEDFNFVDGAIPEDADADDVENHPPNPYVEVHAAAAAANRGNAPLAAAEDEGEMIARIGAAGAPAGQQQFAAPKSAARAGPYGQFGNGAAPPRNNNFGAGFQQHNGYGAAGPAGVRNNNVGGNQFGGQQFGGAARGFGGGFGNANNAGANMEVGRDPLEQTFRVNAETAMLEHELSRLQTCLLLQRARQVRTKETSLVVRQL